MAIKFSSNPLEFFRAVKHLGHLAKQAQKLPEAQKTAWREDMHKNRWKYFLTLQLYIALIIFFLWIGVKFKYQFGGPIQWYIYMGLASIFFLLGIFTFFNYLWLIIKGRKNQRRV